jgi:hypothetical protein
MAGVARRWGDESSDEERSEGHQHEAAGRSVGPSSSLRTGLHSHSSGKGVASAHVELAKACLAQATLDDASEVSF